MIKKKGNPVRDIAKSLKKKLTERKEIPCIDFSKGLSSGSTLLNLACTGHCNVGFLPGHYYRFCGDSDSGKTFVTLATLAEASINPVYADYDLIYDGPEVGALMNTRKFYGSKFQERVRTPSQVGASSTVEEFYYNLDDLVQAGRPFLYVLDSMDSLTSDAEVDSFQEAKAAFRKGKEGPGSYNVSKPKQNSSRLRAVMAFLEKTGSILLIVSQTRDNISTFSRRLKTVSGGHALTFYATIEIWTSVKKHLEKTVKGKQVVIGQVCKFHVTRTRVTGRDCTVEVPIYPSFGIDDVGSMIEFLVEWRHWAKLDSSSIKAPEFGMLASKEDLVRKIEEENLEPQLKLITAGVWKEIEEACRVQRKFRYEAAE